MSFNARNCRGMKKIWLSLGTRASLGRPTVKVKWFRQPPSLQMAGVFRVAGVILNFFITACVLDVWSWRGVQGILEGRRLGGPSVGGFSSNVSLLQQLNYRLDRAPATTSAAGAEPSLSLSLSPTFRLYCVQRCEAVGW